MTQWQLPSKRKITGGAIKKNYKKTRAQRGRDYLPARIGKAKSKLTRVRGGNIKSVALLVETANIAIDGKHKKAEILSVSENPANGQFVRRNIITKGAIIETDLGRARVTSRPGQDGTVNAIMIEASSATGSGEKKRAKKA